MPILAEREKTQRIGPLIANAAIPLLATGVFLILRSSTALADKVSAEISVPVRGFLGSVTSQVHFSIMELCYIIFGLWVLLHIVKTVVLLIVKSHRLRTLVRRTLMLITVSAYILAAFCYLWGICYFGTSFSEKSGIDNSGVTVEDLTSVAEYFAKGAKDLAALVPRDSDGHFNAEVSVLLTESTTVYGGIPKEFDSLIGSIYAPKAMLFSRLMSRLGFTGIYFALTGEANVNVDSPRSLLPCTIAHELAHEQGVTSEDEASFVGITACLTSGNTVYEYSGYLDGLINLMNALYKADAAAYHKIHDTYSAEMLTDMADINAYWAEQESSVTTVASTVYDSYLKSNGETSGILSYGECVNLLVSYYAK